MWAAYASGAFPESVLPEGLDKDQFAQAAYVLHDTFALFIAVSKNSAFKDKAEVPVAMFALLQRTNEASDPHVVWFPWATARNRIETTLKFINELRRNVTLVIYAQPDDEKFWWRMTNYGVISRAGRIPHYFNDGGMAHVWHSRR